MKNRNIIRYVLIVFLAIFIIFILNTTVQAAGVDGTTIVLNPRPWRRMDRLCQWKIWLSRKEYNFKNCKPLKSTIRTILWC